MPAHERATHERVLAVNAAAEDELRHAVERLRAATARYEDRERAGLL